MSLPAEGSLSLEQAPPLAVPASLFLLAPVAIGAAGALLLARGAEPLLSGHRAGSGALTHLGTLGFLGSVMLGALYQMVPVVAGAPVPAVRLAHGVHVAWAMGVAALVAAFLSGAQVAWAVATVSLSVAILGFLGPVALALARAPSRTWTRAGMRLAALALAGVASLGLTFAAVRGFGVLPPGYDPATWRLAHMALGLVGWVGGLLVAVSWQVLPMFYLAEEVPPPARGAVTSSVGLTLLLLPVALILGASRGWVAAALAPAALAVWVAHPLLVLPALRRRRRRRPDESLHGWTAALVCAVATGLCGVAATVWDSPRLGVAWAVLAVWGWAGFAIHAMLCRIVPFLVWFHRLSPHVGRAAVPPMRRLLSQERIRRGLVAHGLSLMLLLVAVATHLDPVARAAGGALVLTAALLGSNIVSVLRVRGPSATP